MTITLQCPKVIQNFPEPIFISGIILPFGRALNGVKVLIDGAGIITTDVGFCVCDYGDFTARNGGHITKFFVDGGGVCATAFDNSQISFHTGLRPVATINMKMHGNGKITHVKEKTYDSRFPRFVGWVRYYL